MGRDLRDLLGGRDRRRRDQEVGLTPPMRSRVAPASRRPGEVEQRRHRGLQLLALLERAARLGDLPRRQEVTPLAEQRLNRYKTRQRHERRVSDSGGCRPISRSANRIRVNLSRLRSSTLTVARPTEVTPTTSSPSADQAKWSFHRSTRGLNNRCSSPTSGSIPVRRSHFRRLHAKQASARFFDRARPPCRDGAQVLHGELNVLPLLWRVAVLAAVTCTKPDGGLHL